MSTQDPTTNRCLINYFKANSSTLMSFCATLGADYDLFFFLCSQREPERVVRQSLAVLISQLAKVLYNDNKVCIPDSEQLDLKTTFPILHTCTQIRTHRIYCPPLELSAECAMAIF